MRGKVKHILKNLDLCVAGTALIALVFLTFSNVIMRRIFNNPIQWTEEVQKICFIWIIYFGAGAVFRNGGHVAIDIVVDLFPARLQRIIEIAGTLITVGVLSNLCYQSYLLVQQYYVTARVTNLLKIPFYIVYSAIPIGCLIMVVSVIWAEYQKIKEKQKEEIE